MNLRHHFLVLLWINIFFVVAFISPIRAEDKTSKTYSVCPNRVEIIHDSEIKFSKNEKNFLCGDPNVKAWQDLPISQIQYHIKTFLETRGFFQTQFKISGQILKVYPGNTINISEVTLTGNQPDFINIKRRWKTIGTKLTPASLSELEGWIKSELNRNGYACPNLKSHAHVISGRVEIEIDPGPQQNISSILQESVPGLDVGSLRRYDTFQLELPFNSDLLTLTSQEIENDGVLQSTFFTWRCQEDGVELLQRTHAGKSKQIRIGFGVDTQEYIIVRGSWKHHRIGRHGSNLGLSWFASFREQLLKLENEWYAFPPLNPWFFKPRLTIQHEWESDFHYLSGDVYFPVARNYNNQKFSLYYSLGPDFNTTYSFEGADKGITKFLRLQGEAIWTDHYYKIFQNNPHRGYQVQLKANLSSQKILSDISTQSFQLDWHYYYNFKKLDPPLLVFGWRGGLSSTLVSGNESNRDRLPPNYRYYLGGSTNLRGFSRKELPRNIDDIEVGALSAAYLSFELRLANYIPFGIQPIIFFDAGMMGDGFMNFNSPLYYSPGAGVRVDSPFGVFRTTFAHGFKTGDDNDPGNTHFQFLFSFGEEF
ncbi:MAG: BamA/TamA family outer membrane protein [Deltaproteobacteria bacterium]|nr:BamA/TamA family outer membrane protein [Deltaproteobacteria bacterium]